MCNHMEAEPGPPLKEKVTGRWPAGTPSSGVSDVKHEGIGVANGITNGQLADCGRVVNSAAANGDLMMRDDRCRLGHIKVQTGGRWVGCFRSCGLRRLTM